MSKKLLFMMLFFACFGMATEIFTVAFTNLIHGTPLWEEPLWSLTGKTYVWMFLIYMLIPVIGGPLFKVLQRYHIVLRLIIYTAVLLTIEFIAGWLLDITTGKCPWEYTTGLHIMGYTKLNLAPAWAFFTFLIERLYLYLNRNLR